jgi:hypothetical protein
VQSVGYDPQGHVLEIEFQNDGVYQYEDVEQDIYTDLMAAPSKGRYFAERIRDNYSWRRVEKD